MPFIKPSTNNGRRAVIRIAMASFIGEKTTSEDKSTDGEIEADVSEESEAYNLQRILNL